MKNHVTVIFIVLAFLLNVCPSAYASSKLLRITDNQLNSSEMSLNADNFPKTVVLGLSVPYDDGDLMQNNFTVRENGQNAKFSLTSPYINSSKRAVDIVFIHDDSGSLDDEAAQVKANITSFLTALSQNNFDYNLALVPYGGDGRSYSFSTPSGVILDNGIMTKDTNQIINNINRMQFDGGEERAYDAISLAIREIAFRPSAQKIFIFITDEDNDPGYVEKDELIEQLQDAGVILYALYYKNDYYSVDHFEELVEKTGGVSFNVTDSFEDILEAIGEQVSSLYEIKYTPPNDNADGTTRTVELTVSTMTENVGFFTKTYVKQYSATALDVKMDKDTEKDLEKPHEASKDIRVEAVIDIKGLNNSASPNIAANLFYVAAVNANNSSSNWTKVPMTQVPNTENIFAASIPASAVKPPYVAYYLSASDGNQTKTIPSLNPTEKPNILSVLPNTPPVITHTPVIKASINQPIKVEAVVNDATQAVARVSLYYRNKGDIIFNEVKENYYGTTANFSAIIPPVATTDTAIEYYIEAEDNYKATVTKGSVDNPLTIIISSGDIGPFYVSLNDYCNKMELYLTQDNYIRGYEYGCTDSFEIPEMIGVVNVAENSVVLFSQHYKVDDVDVMFLIIELNLLDGRYQTYIMMDKDTLLSSVEGIWSLSATK